MGIADLGGLGSKEGPAVAYDWTAANLMPQLIPWILLLGLVLLKANRSIQVAWICAALIGVGAVRVAFGQIFRFLGSEDVATFGDLLTVLSLGVAAVWLLSPLLVRKGRFLNYLAILVALVIGTLCMFCIMDGVSENSSTPSLIMLFFITAMLATALSLSAFHCRRRYGPVKFVFWISIWILVLFVIVSAPILLFEMATTSGRAPWMEFFLAVLVTAGMSLLILLPFLVLSFVNGFWRERFMKLMHFSAPTETAAGAPPVMPAEQAAG